MENKKLNEINKLRKVYVDSSIIINPYFKEFIKRNKICACISELTLLELQSYKMYNKTFDNDIEEIIKNMEILKINKSILRMAKGYIETKIMAKEKYNEALHISIARYYKCSTIIYDREVLSDKNINFNKIYR